MQEKSQVNKIYPGFKVGIFSLCVLSTWMIHDPSDEGNTNIMLFPLTVFDGIREISYQTHSHLGGHTQGKKFKKSLQQSATTIT